MNGSFSRIITLLRKEKGISQKQVSKDLGISQALLSHYEKGIRECGLEFLVKCATYYDVSCDYLLGRTPDRSGAFLTFEDLPDSDVMGKENVLKGSVLPTLNKRLISNSLNILYDKLQICGNKNLTSEVSMFLMLAVYKATRIVYSANPKNITSTFAAPATLSHALASASMEIAESTAMCLAKGEAINNLEGVTNPEKLAMSPETLTVDYPMFSTSLLNLIQVCEARMSKTSGGQI